MNVRDIPTTELYADLAETLEDIVYCEQAIRMGVRDDEAGCNIHVRLRNNVQIRKMIYAELRRRGESVMALGNAD